MGADQKAAQDARSFPIRAFGCELRWETNGVCHSCDGAQVHPGVRLLWPTCGQGDVPAGAAFKATPATPVTCEACLTALSEAPPQ